MILVLGVWTYFRTLCLGAATVSLENVGLGHQLAVQGVPVGSTLLGLPLTRVDGLAVQLESSFSPRLSLPGITRVFSSTGIGNRDLRPPAARRSIATSVS
jgi:hypothetical protein